VVATVVAAVAARAQTTTKKTKAVRQSGTPYACSIPRSD
jgi:hypothetical protein